MSVVIPLLLGRTVWFCGVELPLDPPLPPLDPPEDDDAAWAFTPPGVSRIVLEGGGWLDPLLDPPLDPLEEDCSGGGHGCTATVWVSVPCGTTTRFEPGGIFALPDCAT
jgi:hypothetical protein